MPKKYKNEIVRFGENVPMELILDVNPSEVNGKKMTGDYGDYISYMYYAQGNKMFFATQILHDRLQGLKKGDKVTIEKIKTADNRVNWSVNGSTARVANSAGQSSAPDGLVAKVLMSLTKIESDLELIKKYIYGDKAKAQIPDTEEEDEEEVEDGDLGF